MSSASVLDTRKDIDPNSVAPDRPYNGLIQVHYRLGIAGGCWVDFQCYMDAPQEVATSATAAGKLGMKSTKAIKDLQLRFVGTMGNKAAFTTSPRR